VKCPVICLLLAALVSSVAPASGRKEGAQKTIVMVALTGATSLSDSMQAGLTAFGKDHPDVAVSMMSPPAEGPDAQGKAVRDLAAKGVNAILVVPDDPSSLAEALTQARAAGAVTLTTGSPRQQQASCDVEAFDASEYGRHMMDVMATWMGYSGSWQPLVGRRGSTTDNQWVDGELAEARAAYPGLTMAVERQEDQEDEQVAHDRVIELLQKHPDVKAIMGSSAAGVRGAARAVTEMGLIGEVGVFGSCFPSAAGDYIRSGAVIAINFWVPADAAYATARAAYELLKGGTIASGMDMGRPGYDRVAVRPNDFRVPVIYGSAWVTVNRDTLKDWIGTDGKYKL
jgi:simple sugar transport system substrate-binding protein